MHIGKSPVLRPSGGGDDIRGSKPKRMQIVGTLFPGPTKAGSWDSKVGRFFGKAGQSTRLLASPATHQGGRCGTESRSTKVDVLNMHKTN